MTTTGRHYTVNSVEEHDAWGLLRETFAEPVDYTLNWLFLSTSGVHGTYETLNDLPETALEMREEYPDEPWEPSITFQIIAPRMCRIFYGNVVVETDEQDAWLRDVVAKTIEGVATSQSGNLPR